jgi:glycylpeptide N-tetradecanoyltransferase
LNKFKLAIVFSEEEFAHWLLPREGVVSSYVVVKEGSGEVTDFCSYYHLHSSVLGNPKHSTLFAGYSFYNVATTVDLTELMRDCLIMAKNEGLDVFNALNLMENDRFLHDLKFGMGDGNLQYYIYNWFCPTMDHGDVGIVLL